VSTSRKEFNELEEFRTAGCRKLRGESQVQD
jgi:hypothetical protein